MNNSTKKRNKYNDIVVKRLAEKWGVTTHYVRMCLRGDRICETADSIIKDYKRINQEVENALRK